MTLALMERGKNRGLMERDPGRGLTARGKNRNAPTIYPQHTAQRRLQICLPVVDKFANWTRDSA